MIVSALDSHWYILEQWIIVSEQWINESFQDKNCDCLEQWIFVSV